MAMKPEDWQIANVIPIIKKGRRGDPRNYRSNIVNLTLVLGKKVKCLIKD